MMKNNFLKRVLSAFLTLIMVLTLVPLSAVPVFAKSVSGGSLGQLGVTGSDSVIGSFAKAKGEININASDKSIDLMIPTTYNSITKKYTTYELTTTLTNNSGNTAVLSFDYRIVDCSSVTIDDEPKTGSGAYTITLGAGASVVIYMKSHESKEGNTYVYLTNVNLADANAKVTTSFVASEGGTYTVNGLPVGDSYSLEHGATEAVKLEATAADGYEFYGWLACASGSSEWSLIKKDNPLTTEIAENGKSIKPSFILKGSALFETGGKEFVDLNEAVAASLNNGSKKVTLAKTGALPAGDYTVPAGVTLLIPFDEAGTVSTDEPICDDQSAYPAPTPFRKLIMQPDSTINIYGTMCINGKIRPAAGGQSNACVFGNVGWVEMGDDSQITVKNGGKLYAWGYITDLNGGTGTGNVVAESGAKVYEPLIIEDFRGGDASGQMVSGKDKKVFIFSQYYVQNIEVPLTINQGAEEWVNCSVSAARLVQSKEVEFVGTKGLFRLGNGSSLTKKYNPKTDRMSYDLYGDATLDCLVVDGVKLTLTDIIKGQNLSSADYVMPINNNMDLSIHSGETSINYDICLLPGVKVTVDAEATLKVGANANIYVYDETEWKADKFVQNGYFTRIYYAPTRKYTRTNNDIVDVRIDVNGTVISDGFIYTTPSGAEIVSSKGTGKCILNSGAGTKTETYQVTQNTTEITYVSIPITSAKLKNADGSYTLTDDAVPGTTYTYKNGKWVTPCETHVEEVRNAKAATCTEDGYTGDTYCTVCGEKIKDGEVITANGHTWNEGSVTKESTCTAEGTKTFTCTVCGATKVEAIPLKAHTEEIIPAKDATCTATGLTEGKKCSVCGEILVKQEVIPAKGHTEETVPAKDATCTATGLTEGKKCSVCGEILVKQEVIPAKGHTVEIDAAVAPTHTTEGKTEGSHCSVCGEIIKAQETIPALSDKHTWGEGVVTAEPTCTKDGVKTYTCAECGEKTTDAIPAKGHNFSGEKTFIAPTTDSQAKYIVKCTRCDETEERLITDTGLYVHGDDIYYIDADTHYAVTGLVRIVTADGEINYYYFGEDCKAFKAAEGATGEDKQCKVEKNNGLALPPGIKYNFRTDGVIEFFADAPQGETEAVKTVYTAADGKRYYCIDGVVVAIGLIEFEGNYYYARTSNGEIVCNRDYYVTVTNGLMEAGNYHFDEQGRLSKIEPVVKNGIIAEDGSLYYYENNMRKGAGLIKIGEDYYYVRTSTGEVVNGRSYWITVTNDYNIPAKIYDFDENGKMINPPVPDTTVRDGIVEEDGSLYYYENGKRKGAGLIKIGDDYYYVKTSTGEVVHGRIYWITATNGYDVPAKAYTFDADGKMQIS